MGAWGRLWALGYVCIAHPNGAFIDERLAACALRLPVVRSEVSVWQFALRFPVVRSVVSVWQRVHCVSQWCVQ